MTAPSLTVVKAIAEATESNPTDLDPPIHHVLDPDALDSLLEGDPEDTDAMPIAVRFEYHGYEVVVYQDDTVELDGTAVIPTD
jgi:hypothetical protein